MYDPKICNQCGKCCHAGIDDRRVMRSHVCKFLQRDEANSNITACSVYQNRFIVAPWCLSVSEAIEQKRLPNDCPYVEDDPDYEGADYMSKELELKIITGPHYEKWLQPNVKFWQGPNGE